MLTDSNTAESKNLTPSYIDISENLPESIIQVNYIQKLSDDWQTVCDEIARIRNTTAQKRNTITYT